VKANSTVLQICFPPYAELGKRKALEAAKSTDLNELLLQTVLGARAEAGP